MKKINFVITGVLCCLIAAGQKTDTANRVKSDSIPETWKRFEPGIRLAVGAQKAFFYEAGIAFQKYVYSRHHGFQVYTFYGSYERTHSNAKRPPVQGLKIGYEIVNIGATGGIEVRYLWDGLTTDWVITPRYGLGLGAVNIFYGYNISTNKRPFVNIGRHQFTLVINTNIAFHYLKEENKK